MPRPKGLPKTGGRKKKPDMPRLVIEYRPLDWFKPYERNPRKNDKAVDRMRASIREYGFTIPILARSNGDVIDGHLRLKAGTAEKIPQLPVILCDSWTDAQVKAFRLMVNRSVTWADWDMDALALEFADLGKMEFDLSLTGFDPREIDAFTLAPNSLEDDVPPVPLAPVTQPGDVWLLGPHRLLCGDATKIEDAARLNEGGFDLCFTSPPYNAGSYTLTGNVKKRDKTSRYENSTDDLSEDQYVNLLVGFTGVALSKCKTVAVNIQQLAGNKFAVLRWVNEFRDHFVDRAVWYKGKGNPAMAPSVMASRYEDFWIFAPDHRPSRAIPTAIFRGTVYNVFESVGASAENDQPGRHCATMPVSVAKYAITSWSERSHSIYDPFLGSGTTLVSCELTGRICYGLEIDPGYCDVIKTRWENLTGKKAVLEARN